MRSDQRSKLETYKRRLAEAREKRLLDAVSKATEALASSASSIRELADKEAPAPVIQVDTDTNGIAEAITAGLSNVVIENKVNPEIKIDMPQQAAPTVVVTNDDIYARYKRYNSRIDPEGTYHAFLDTDGNWFIQLESTMQGGTVDITRYAVGKGGIAQAWAGRKRLSYKPLDKVTIA